MRLWANGPKKSFPALLVILAMVAGLVGYGWPPVWAGEASPYRTKHVIVAVMDGVRYSETFGDPQHRYVPRMWRELVPQGVLYTNYYNQGVTVTRQGHSSIASGTWQTVPNGGPRLTRPTFFDYYRDETGAPKEKTWAIFGKGAYSFAPYSSFPAYGDKFAPSAEIGLGEGSMDDDRRVLNRILEVMRDHKPALIFANFGYTDHAGHQASFDEYTRAVANVDSLFADLWAAIQADPEYRDATTLILTNDHGRHDDAHGGYHGHGDGCEGCRHNFLLILGPDTKKGVILDTPASQIDIAPTVGELLGFQTPLAEGRVLAESFISYKNINRKEARTATAREAVRLQALAERDLGRVVAHRFLAAGDLNTLPANAETFILFHGLLGKGVGDGKLSPVDETLAIRAAEDWLEKNKTGDTAAQIYRGLIALELGRRKKEPDLPRLDSLQEATLGVVDRAFALDLLVKTAARGRGENGLAGAEKLLTSLSPREKSGQASLKTAPHEEALVLYALADAFAAVAPRKENKSGFQARLREACLSRYLQAMKAQTEPGGLWPDPIDSLLYLAAAERLEQAGLLRELRAEETGVKGKTVPKIPQRVLEQIRDLRFSRELTRYFVDEEGRVCGGTSPLATGAFLMLW